MRFHTDAHVALELLEQRASHACLDAIGEFLQSLGTVAPAAAETAGALGEIAPIVIGEGIGTTIPGIIDNTLSPGLLDALFGYQGIDPGLLSGGVLDAATGAINLSGLIDNSGSGISSILGGGGGTGLDLSGLLGGAGGGGGTIGGTGGTSGGGIKAPTAPMTPAGSPAPSVTGPSPFADATKIDNTGTGVTGAAGGGAGSSAITAPPAPTGGGSVGTITGAGTDSGSGSGGKGVLGGISGFLRENAPLLSLGALGASALMPKSNIPNMGAINKNVSAISDTAQSLIPAVSTGVLPAGAEQMVQNATKDAITNIKARYASMGLSGSTMEGQDIAAAQERAQATRFQIAKDLTTTGLNAAGLADQIYAQIAGIQLSQDSALQQALANFAQAMALGQGVRAA